MSMHVSLECGDLHVPILIRACDSIVSQPEQLLVELLVAVIVALILLVIKPIRIWIWQTLRVLFGFVAAGWNASSRLSAAEDSVSNRGPGPWLAIKPKPPSGYDDRMESAVTTMPVVVCANLKGGVGKTTITANVAASFAQKIQRTQDQKPVLVIDLDFQGSLSSMLFVGSRRRLGLEELSPASNAIDGQKDNDWLFVNSQSVTWVDNPDSENPRVQLVPGLRGISALYDLAETEDRLRLLWAIATEERDIRYFLYELLHNETIRTLFSMVFIDAPPRLTTGCIQALVASTHLLIPTILDELSAEAVAYFAQQLVRYESLWPHLRILGIIGSMVDLGQPHQLRALTTAIDRLQSNLEGSRFQLSRLRKEGLEFAFPKELFVPERACLSRSVRKGIAYVALGNDQDGRTVRSLFDNIADEIRRRLK
jgi:cellulose biosynthesis protein BcsQ